MPFVHLRRDNKNLQFYWMLFFSSPDTGAPNGLYCTQQALFIKDHGMKMNCIWKAFSSKSSGIEWAAYQPSLAGEWHPGCLRTPQHTFAHAERRVFTQRQRCGIWESKRSDSCSYDCVVGPASWDFFFYLVFVFTSLSDIKCLKSISFGISILL